jgi:hypothetical protein
MSLSKENNTMNTNLSRCTLGAYALLAVSVTAGCASTRTQVNRDAHFQKHPTRIYVVGNLDGFGPTFADEFRQVFDTEISRCGGNVEFSRITALELDSSQRNAEIDQFKPDALIFLHLTHTTIDTYGQLLQATVDTQVIDPEQKKVVWRGNSNMQAGGMFTPSSTRAQSLSKDLLLKLRQDGMVPACSAALPETTAGK